MVLFTAAERVAYLRREHALTEYPVACCRKDHQNWPCDTIQALDSAAEVERDRIYTELGNDHYVVFDDDGYQVEHSVQCRLSGRMGSCEWWQYVKNRWSNDMGIRGKWRITDVIHGGAMELIH